MEFPVSTTEIGNPQSRHNQAQLSWRSRLAKNLSRNRNF
jgi:hypothetical protein